MTEVTRDQFEVHPLQATHRPTGAKVCWPTIAAPDFHFADRGRIGEVLENGKVYGENDVLVVGVGLLMELFAKRREMSETPAKVEPNAEGLTGEERDALAVLRQLTLRPGQHTPLPTLIARWGTRGSAQSLLKALDALVGKGLAEASSDQFTFALKTPAMPTDFAACRDRPDT